MKITALMMVRNEQWALGLALRAALMWCDDVLVLDHGSTDRTPQIIDDAVAEFGGERVKVMRVDEPQWDEMTRRNQMLETARLSGATHCAIVDADELLTGNLLNVARRMFDPLRPGNQLALPMVSTYLSLSVRRWDRSFGELSSLTLGFMDAPELSWRPAHDGYQYHARPPKGSTKTTMPIDYREGGVFHLQYVTQERLQAKAVWYKLVELLRWPGRKSVHELNHMYGWTLDRTDIKTSAIDESWWAPYRDLMSKHLDISAECWHAEEVRRLLEEHGCEKFRGLELYGF